MVVTYKVSYSNNNDGDEFSRKWNALASANKMSPLFFKKVFHLKTRRVFDTSCMYVKQRWKQILQLKTRNVKNTLGDN